MSEVIIKNLSKSFGNVNVLKDIDLTVEDGSFVVLVGPSGCGKSTLLRCIAGLEPINAGHMTIGGKVVNDLPPAKREIAMVFQSYALYPHMNVEKNMGFGLRFSGTPKSEIAARVNEAARILQLEPLLKRRPRELSGGQRQRVAIGRAIVRKPQVFLFDEPLSNLDAALRINTRVEIAKLHKLLKATIVYVTHDQVEAMTLADQIIVMNQGKIEQAGRPLDLYYKPANLFVAGFIGSPAMNFLAVEVSGIDTVALSDGSAIAVKLPSTFKIGDKLTLGCRPEHMSLTNANEASLTGTVDLIERLGEVGYAYVKLSNGQTVTVEVRGASKRGTNDRVNVSFEAAKLQLFDANGNAI
jgi:ABC-type sugar transport system ATPase subunit